MNGCSGGGGDMFRRNSAVDEVVIANIEVVDHRGVIVNLRYLCWSSAKAVWVRVTKMTDRHKRETIHAQTKVEPNTNAAALVKKADAFSIHRKWR
jgi:hypothetical protein